MMSKSFHRSGSSRREKIRGVSMIELMIAIFVVAVGILGTVSALWYGIRSERYADRRTQAVYQAREMINLIRARNLPYQGNNLNVGSFINDGDYDNDADDAVVKKDFNAAPFGNDFTNAFNFKRHIEMKVMSSDPTHHMSEMVGIKVTLFWIDGSAEKKVTLWAYHRRP